MLDRSAPSAGRAGLVSMLTSLALLASVPVPFLALAWSTGLAIDIGMVALGAAGWLATLLARVPLIFLLARPGLAERSIWLSGPVEEATRLALLLAFVDEAGQAYSLGLGWGLAEVPYTLMETLLLHRLGARTVSGLAPASPSSMEASMATLAAEPWSPWRTLERYSAMAIHVGLSLLLFWQPALVVLTALGHSLTNYVFLRAAALSIRWAEALAAVVGCGALMAGLAVSL